MRFAKRTVTKITFVVNSVQSSVFRRRCDSGYTFGCSDRYWHVLVRLERLGAAISEFTRKTITEITFVDSFVQSCVFRQRCDSEYISDCFDRYWYVLVRYESLGAVIFKFAKRTITRITFDVSFVQSYVFRRFSGMLSIALITLIRVWPGSLSKVLELLFPSSLKRRSQKS